MSNRKPPKPYRPGCDMNIRQWCEKRGFTAPTYYKLQREGRGPAELRFGRHVRITTQADEDWERMMRETPPPAYRLHQADESHKQAVEASRAAVASEKHIAKVRAK